MQILRNLVKMNPQIITTNNSILYLHENEVVKVIRKDLRSYKEIVFHITLSKLFPHMVPKILSIQTTSASYKIHMERCEPIQEMKEEYIEPMLKCVATLHSCGIAHNDISLGNFLLRDGTVLISDFGNAEYVSTIQPYCSRTHPSYLFRDKSWIVDYKEDMWSLGMILYAHYTEAFISYAQDPSIIHDDFLRTFGVTDVRSITTELIVSKLGDASKYAKVIASLLLFDDALGVYKSTPIDIMQMIFPMFGERTKQIIEGVPNITVPNYRFII